MSENLKPCPFCGSHDVQLANENYDPCTYKFGHCECGAKGPERLIAADAIAAWNLRVLSPKQQEEVEMLREALEKIAAFATGFGPECEIIARTARATLTQGEEK